MILTDIKRYVATSGPTTAVSVAAHFDLEPTAAQAMLDRLAALGAIARLADPAQCRGCSGTCDSHCGPAAAIYGAAKG